MIKIIKTAFKDSKTVKRIENNKPKWGGHAIRLARACTYQVKNTHGVYHTPPRTWHSLFPHLLMIN